MQKGPKAAAQPDRGATPLALPVVPLPVPEETSELEGRWAAANLFAAFAIGGVLARAAHHARFRWWFLNLPVGLLVGAAGSLGGSAVTYGARRAWPLVFGQESSREQRFWARFIGSFFAAGFTFDVLTTRLEGRAVWRGTYAWWWTIGWPLAALMLFVNATEVQAGGRLAAERRRLSSDRTSLKNHYALDADLARLAQLQVPFTFVYFDLDGFKQVNDQLGHKDGDDVLAETEAILSQFESQLEAIGYHLHGDEFAFLVPGHDEAKVEELVRRASSEIRVVGVQRSIDLGATFGAAFSSPTGGDPNAVRHVADAHMRRAKEAGKRRLMFASGRLVDLRDVSETLGEMRRAAILTAHGRLLNQAADFLQGVQITVEGKPGQAVVFALVARVIQIGCALQELLERGYGGEASSLARSMLTGMLHIVALVDADTDGRALQFITDAENYQLQLTERAERHGIWDSDRAKAERASVVESYRAFRERFAKQGVVPSKIKPGGTRTWHGLNSERELFETMGMTHIYELDYAWLSDETHVNIGAVSQEVVDALDGRIGFGPKGELPREILFASSYSIPEALAQLSNLLGLNRRDEAAAMQKEFRDVLRKSYEPDAG